MLRHLRTVASSQRWRAPALALQHSVRSLSSLQTESPWTFDCTGRAVECKEDQLDALNHVVSNFITGNETYFERYGDLLERGGGGVLSISLALIDKTRCGAHCSTSWTRDALREKLLQQNIGSEFIREQHLASAALQWDAGRHAQAAVTLESLLSAVGNDVLSARLAQEAHVLSGQSESALGCLIRHPATFAAFPPFDATITGLTSVGYLETARLADAEDAARRAVEMSGGRDLVSLLALLDALYLSGKSSDMLEVLENHAAVHAATALGKAALMVRKGAAQVMRGNCNGGFKSLVQVFERDAKSLPLSLTVPASLLLWQIVFNLDSRHVLALDEVVDVLGEIAAAQSADDDALQPLLHTISLAARLHSLESKNCAEYLEARKADISASSAAARSKQSSKWNPLSFFRSEENDHESLVPSDSLRGETQQQAKTSGLPVFAENVEQENQRRIDTTKTALREQISSLDAHYRALATRSQPSSAVAEKLVQWASKQTRFEFLCDDTVDDAQPRLLALSALCQAIAHFALKEYEASVRLLTPLHHRGYRSTGLPAAQRDVIWQMFIEGLIRDNQFEGAAMLLSERTVLVPNDGQTWKRLSFIHRANGQEKLAEEAQYTAWQLGIGQGGFGGPI